MTWLLWIEDTLWIGEGRFVVDEKGSAVEYTIFKVGNKSSSDNERRENVRAREARRT